MLDLIFTGKLHLFVTALTAIIFSLSFHEYGHAATAKYFGDNTAERQGRLTLNPIAHIDPTGLLLVVLLGFGFARPVPTDPRNYNSAYAPALVAAAGPLMNLLLAFVSVNLLVLSQHMQISWLLNPLAQTFLQYMTFINLLLMLFNLLPIGPLDGHYIVPYFLSRDNAIRFLRWNDNYGHIALLSLVILSIVGVPVFAILRDMSLAMARYLVVVG